MRYDIRGKRTNGRQCNLTVYCASTDEIWDCALQSQPDLAEIHTVNGAQFQHKTKPAPSQPVMTMIEPVIEPEDDEVEESD